MEKNHDYEDNTIILFPRTEKEQYDEDLEDEDYIAGDEDLEDYIAVDEDLNDDDLKVGNIVVEKPNHGQGDSSYKFHKVVKEIPTSFILHQLDKHLDDNKLKIGNIVVEVPNQRYNFYRVGKETHKSVILDHLKVSYAYRPRKDNLNQNADPLWVLSVIEMTDGVPRESDSIIII